MLEKDLKKVIEGVYPFHMPGHKRNPRWTEGLHTLDITEISGADDLHAPSGIIAAAQSRATALYGTVSTLFLTGGSTCGILSAIWAACRQGDKIIIGRNCHRSVYNACMLRGLSVNYIYPEVEPRLGCFGKIQPAALATALEESGAKVVVVTSPTYEGIHSDIKALARLVHGKGGILIVDAAHGAHLGFKDYFGPSPRDLGADLVIESAHKTLPCLTGAALLHICSHRVSYRALQEALGIFETSSPPFPIVASIDRALTAIREEDIFTPYAAGLEEFYAAAKNFKRLSLFSSGSFDRGKLVISTSGSNISGFELKDRLLEDYKIETEMAMPNYTLAMTSPADSAEGFDRLLAALSEIDATLLSAPVALAPAPPRMRAVLPLNFAGDTEDIPLRRAVGRVSAEFVYAYPPGSPIIAPGEIFSAEAADYIATLEEAGAKIYSSSSSFPKYLSVFSPVENNKE